MDKLSSSTRLLTCLADVILDMIDIMRDKDATDEEVEMAARTIEEITSDWTNPRIIK